MHTRYTEAQWEQAYPKLKGFSVLTLEMARAVLVEGENPVDVANEANIRRQSLHGAIQRVSKVLDEAGAKKLVPVLLWVRPEGVEPLKELSLLEDSPPSQKPKGKKK